MATYSLKTIQTIPVNIDKAWEFFTSPDNLQTITPPQMSFRIISKHHGHKMYAGQLIEYEVKPVLGIPVYWMTEITQVKEKQYFIDEQRFGPYQLWHHQHHFKEINGGVEMIDIVHYRNPLGFLGDIANSLFVQKQLKRIFEYRFTKVEEVFGKSTTPQQNIILFTKAA
jgi:ligand-binding SRPBCC domain-containing protein